VDYIASLPCKGARAERVQVNVDAVPLSLQRSGRCQAWHAKIQPAIASEWVLDKQGQKRRRVDEKWNWPYQIEFCRAAGLWRGPRVYQLTVGKEEQPAAMVFLLRKERWIDPGAGAVYVWYLSTAPDSVLSVTTLSGGMGVPGLVGLAALDIGIVESMNAGWKGRLSLHAEPDGEPLALPEWYALRSCATRIPSESHRRLPGVGGWTRDNGPNSHYFAFTVESAQWPSGGCGWYNVGGGDMTIDPRADALVAQTVAGSDPNDEAQVGAFVSKALPRLPARIRGIIFDFLVAADRIPSPEQLDQLRDEIKSQSEVEARTGAVRHTRKMPTPDTRPAYPMAASRPVAAKKAKHRSQ
jgi:hypothetical protein